MISYKFLDESLSFYEDKGYRRIETPWLVSPQVSAITRPDHAADYRVKTTDAAKVKSFVASGEQSFLYLINKGHMPTSGMYQTITPCMRHEDFDETHTKYFIKNELIAYGEWANQSRLEMMVDQASSFFEKILIFYRISTEHLRLRYYESGQIDIELDGVEIGSYGIRECSFTRWVYGTGLAEPRFSREVKRLYDGLPRSNNR
jgi:hypothetical protein